MNRWVWADLHLGHKNICEFNGVNGLKLRPWNNIDEMHEALINNHNSVVSPKDTVYYLGDVCINKKFIHLLSLFNGRKILVKGNHDIFDLKYYLPYFDDIRAFDVKDRIVMSHIPIHDLSKQRYVGNIHGHLHDGCLEDPFYLCVSVERTNYTPVLFEDCVKKIKENTKVD